MKIIFAIKTLTIAGGAERVLIELANALSRREHQIFVVTYDNNSVHPFYSLDSEICVNYLNIGSVMNSTTATETLTRMYALRKAILKIKPDVVVGFMTSMYIPLSIALVGTSIPMVASEHTTYQRYCDRYKERIMLTCVPLFTDAITVVSPEAKDSFSSSLRSTMMVVPNPVSINVVKCANVDGAVNKRKILLSVGRLTESKDYQVLVDAFAAIAHMIPDWDLKIVGDGHLRGMLQNRIRESGMQSRIWMPGTTERIYTEYENAQLFVIPSRYESLGLVVLEALSHGLPVVGFADCSGINRIVRSGYNGLLVGGKHRVEELARSLLLLMQNVRLRKRLSHQKYSIPTEYMLDNVISKWEEILLNVIYKNKRQKPFFNRH